MFLFSRRCYSKIEKLTVKSHCSVFTAVFVIPRQPWHQPPWSSLQLFQRDSTAGFFFSKPKNKHILRTISAMKQLLRGRITGHLIGIQLKAHFCSHSARFRGDWASFEKRLERLFHTEWSDNGRWIIRSRNISRSIAAISRRRRTFKHSLALEPLCEKYWWYWTGTGRICWPNRGDVSQIKLSQRDGGKK